MKKLKVCFLFIGLLFIMSVAASATSSYASIGNGVSSSEGNHIYISNATLDVRSNSGSMVGSAYQVVKYWPDNCARSVTVASGSYAVVGNIKLNSSRQSYIYLVAGSNNADGEGQLY